jgi:hypothetical protein
MPYLRFSRHAFPVAALLFICWSRSPAQGIYYSNTAAGSYLWGDTSTYGSGGSCGGFSAFNDFDNNYETGGVPGAINEDVFANYNTSYPWSFGISGFVPNPYSGCSSFAVNFTFTLTTASVYTYYQAPTKVSGSCVWPYLACLPGTTPTCTGGENLGIYLTCPYYIGGEYLVTILNGVRTVWCGAAIPIKSTGSGNCT